MANKWINYVYQETDYRRGDLTVALKLADTANAHTDECTLKLATIGTATRIGERHITRILKHLEGDGFVEIVRRRGRGNAPTFKLQRMTSRTPFKDREATEKAARTVSKKVTSGPPFTEIKGDISDTNGDVKGDMCDTEKVTVVTSTPIYEPLREPKKKTTPPKNSGDFQRLMDHHSRRLSAPIPDGGAQGKAIKWLMSHYSSDDCVAYYDYQVQQLQANGGWRESMSWLTVKSKIAEWVNAGRPKGPTERNGTHQYKSFRDQRADEARRSAQRESEIRERVERRKAGLSGSSVSDNPRQLPPFEPVTDG